MGIVTKTSVVGTYAVSPCGNLYERGAYYRIYSAVVTNEGSLVVYSDDFGGTWKPLGGADARPAPDVSASARSSSVMPGRQKPSNFI